MMTKEKHLHDLTLIMAVCNLAVILFYCLIRTVTTYRICGSFGAYDFLSTVRTMPQRPWVIPVQALGLYLLLCLLSYLKFRWKMCSLWGRLSVCVAELLLCIGVIASLDFYYSGVALLVLADLIYYIQHNRLRLFFMAVLIILFAFAQFEIVSLPDHSVAFTSYLSYYTPFVRSVFTGIESVLVSGNILLFVLYMILLFTGEQAENDRIRKLNQQLNDANTQLKDYAVELERMTEIRERNRLAREIHDTLGHTLTGIIMGADAALALFSMAPEEAKKRVQVIAQSARDGLTDVRRSIKALRPDALEQRSLEQALEKLVADFRLTTGVEILYEPLSAPLSFAPDEEDAIYRIVQESMTNAVRHGHASKIHLSLTWQDHVLTVQVRDNGLGCVQPEEGFGLRHMKERLCLLGGTLAYGNGDPEAGAAQTGFFVTANIPVRGKEGGLST